MMEEEKAHDGVKATLEVVLGLDGIAADQLDRAVTAVGPRYLEKLR